MLKYLAANMDPTSKPLGEILATTHIGQHEAGSPKLTIALGWHILHAPDGTGIVFHTGGTGGYRSFIGFDPVTHVGVVVLTNSAIGADDIGLHLIDQRIPLVGPPAAPKEAEIEPRALE
jgi:CubicO group peptidase (beta-lactamase class C family)